MVDILRELYTRSCVATCWDPSTKWLATHRKTGCKRGRGEAARWWNRYRVPRSSEGDREEIGITRISNKDSGLKDRFAHPSRPFPIVLKSFFRIQRIKRCRPARQSLLRRPERKMNVLLKEEKQYPNLVRVVVPSRSESLMLIWRRRNMAIGRLRSSRYFHYRASRLEPKPSLSCITRQWQPSRRHRNYLEGQLRKRADLSLQGWRIRGVGQYSPQFTMRAKNITRFAEKGVDGCHAIAHTDMRRHE